MKKNDLVQLAILGLAAGFCISGQLAHKDNQELAMTKCSKPEKPADSNENNDEYDSNTSKLDKPKSKPSAMRGKSAAKRVVEGIGPSNTTMDVQRKSAARRSMEEL